MPGLSDKTGEGSGVTSRVRGALTGTHKQVWYACCTLSQQPSSLEHYVRNAPGNVRTSFREHWGRSLLQTPCPRMESVRLPRAMNDSHWSLKVSVKAVLLPPEGACSYTGLGRHFLMACLQKG